MNEKTQKLTVQTIEEFEKERWQGYNFRKNEYHKKMRNLTFEIERMKKQLEMKKEQLQQRKKYKFPSYDTYIKEHTYESWVNDCRNNAKKIGWEFIENEDSKEVKQNGL